VSLLPSTDISTPLTSENSFMIFNSNQLNPVKKNLYVPPVNFVNASPPPFNFVSLNVFQNGKFFFCLVDFTFFLN
jgi:hypothetical protein